MTPPAHPRGLYTLFFTEMWERLSYYGMRALLLLFMIASVESGGLGFDAKVAASIYGLYTAGVYLAALPGGWIADRLLGTRRAIWVGGSLIALGHFTLVVHRTETFFVGLLLIVLGTGLLKPNISALLGELYPEGGDRRDAGFTIFYMGINLGAFIGPLICSALGERVNWHYGFAAAGIGMVFGLVQFGLTQRHLGDAGRRPLQEPERSRKDWTAVGIGVAVLLILVTLALCRVIAPDPLWLAKKAAFGIAGLAVAYFGWVFGFGNLDKVERGRMLVIAVLFLASTLFWAGYEQAGSSLTLFAEQYTSRILGGWEMPAGYFQSVSALFVILLSPVVAALWVWLSRRGKAPSMPAKFGWGLILLACGFFVVAIGSWRALKSGPVWPTWLVATYLFHVLGELFVSPVGLSSVTKLAPPRLVSQMMGIWFLGTSLGNLLAGLFTAVATGTGGESLPTAFARVAIFAAVIGLLLFCCAKPIRRLMSGVT